MKDSCSFLLVIPMNSRGRSSSKLSSVISSSRGTWPSNSALISSIEGVSSSKSSGPVPYPKYFWNLFPSSDLESVSAAVGSSIMPATWPSCQWILFLNPSGIFVISSTDTLSNVSSILSLVVFTWNNSVSFATDKTPFKFKFLIHSIFTLFPVCLYRALSIIWACKYSIGGFIHDQTSSQSHSHENHHHRHLLADCHIHHRFSFGHYNRFLHIYTDRQHDRTIVRIKHLLISEIGI